MLTAITRAVSPALDRCELSHLDRVTIDVARAADQHGVYEDCLRELGVRVISLAAEPGLPDSMFVEDPAVVTGEVAIMTRLGAPSRRGESPSLALALSPFRPLRWMREPATLEGGDVLRMGRTFFVGLSARTNAEGIAQLAEELEPLGYAVRPVPVRGCLHLKSASSAIGPERILVNREWIDAGVFAGYELVDVPHDEPRAANVLTIGDAVLAPAAFPATAHLLKGLGLRVRTLDISELMKAEAGLTCSSILFDAA